MSQRRLCIKDLNLFARARALLFKGLKLFVYKPARALNRFFFFIHLLLPRTWPARAQVHRNVMSFIRAPDASYINLANKKIKNLVSIKSLCGEEYNCKNMIQSFVMPTVAIVILAALLRYHWKRRHFYRLSWNMAGPVALPFIGNSLMFLDSSSNSYIAPRNNWTFFINKKNTFIEIMKEVEKLGQMYGSPLRFWLGHRFVIICDRPEHLEVILNAPQTMDKGNVYEFVTKVMGGDGLFTSSGEKKKRI